MNKNLRLLLYLFLLIFASFLVWKGINYFTNNISPKGAYLDEEQLFHDLNLLGEGEIKHKEVRTLVNGFDPYSTVKDHDGNVNKNDRIIEQFITNENSQEYPKPLEVRAAMRTWVYLQDRQLPYPIIGVKIIYSREAFLGVIGGRRSAVILVTKREFEELFKKTSGMEADQEKQIDELTKLWIAEHNYKRADGNW